MADNKRNMPSVKNFEDFFKKYKIDGYITANELPDLSPFATSVDLDSYVKTADIVNDLTTGGEAVPISAEAIKLFIAKFGKQLWTGTWNTGNLTVTGINDYIILFAVITGTLGMFCYNFDTAISAGVVDMGSSTHSTYTIELTKSGEVLTIGTIRGLSHTASGSHGAIVTNSIREWYGVVPRQ